MRLIQSFCLLHGRVFCGPTSQRLYMARCISTARMFSTLVGHSGRGYKRDQVIYSNPRNHAFDVYLARCENQPYIVKRLTPDIFNQSLDLKNEFADTCRLRMHIDYNEVEKTLVYEYYKDDLLSLVKNNPNFPLVARKKILQEAGKALKELHMKNWIHIDVKPDNVMVNWVFDQNGRVRIERVALADLDCSLKVKESQLLRLPGAQRIGNPMWRSPEAQTGKGIHKKSDVFSYGLVCLYTITGLETLHVDFQELRETGFTAEQAILTRMLLFFGPLPQGLLTQVADETWEGLLVGLSQMVEEFRDPQKHFEHWEELDFPNLDAETKRVLSRMLDLDPAKRANMDEILEDPWWG